MKEIHTKTHEGAIRKFGEMYIKTNVLDRKWSDIFVESFEARQAADYQVGNSLTTKEAKELVDNAHAFLQMTKDYFEKLNIE